MTPYSLIAQSSQIYLSQVHVFPLSDIGGKLFCNYFILCNMKKDFIFCSLTRASCLKAG